MLKLDVNTRSVLTCRFAMSGEASMRIPRFYTSRPLSEGACIDLEAEAIHHIVHVLRIKPGREIVLFNGQGGEYRAIVQQATKKTVQVTVQTWAQGLAESPLALHLGICLIKSDPMDWLLQKAVELGVTQITLLLSQYTDIKWPHAKEAKKMQHWRQVMLHACQQSGRTVLPSLAPPMALADWVSQVAAEAKFVLHPHRSGGWVPLANVHQVALLVGPEGGLADAEIGLASQHQFQAVALGSRILRAETAPLAAIALLQHQLGDF